MDENIRPGLRESSKVSTPRNYSNISTLLNNNTEGGYSPVATRVYDEGSHTQEWATEAMDAVTTPLTPTTSAAQATVVQQQQQQQQQAATRRKSSTSSKTSSSGGASNNGPGAPGGMVAMVVRGGNWVGRQRRVSESRSMTRVDNTGSRTQFHAPLEPEVVVKLDEIFFKFLQRFHQPLMAKKMQRLEASTEFRPFKFRIQAFTNAFHDSLIEHGLTEDILPLRKIKVYLWKHRYISRFNEDGKKQKSKGNHVWNIEARKIFPAVTASTPSTPNMASGEVDIKTDLLPGAGGPTHTNNNNTSHVRWEFREYTSRIAGQIIKFARVGIPYVYTPKIWDAQMSSPAAKFSSPWLPPWLRWHKGELKGVPTAEDRSCTITVVAEYLREGEECHLEMSFPLTVSDPSKEGELMDTPEDRGQADVEEEEEEEEEEEGDSELSKEEEEDEVESEVDEIAANDDDDNYRDGAHSQGGEDEDEDDEMDENGDQMDGSDGAESSQSQRSQNQGHKRQGARSKRTNAIKAAATGRTKRGVRGRGRGRGRRLAK
ncbi:hypothetical protein BGZ82_010758 [Podila clonocystis]|nr:hypothetical protein BGZ82_010758 [Podila clonocystis]